MLPAIERPGLPYTADRLPTNLISVGRKANFPSPNQESDRQGSDHNIFPSYVQVTTPFPWVSVANKHRGPHAFRSPWQIPLPSAAPLIV